jgi:hypothetical protein
VRFDAPGVAKSRRYYNGGFSMPGVVQDMKRLFPEAHAFGTGRWSYSPAEVAVLYSWYDINLNNIQEQSRWWMDLESLPTDAQKSWLVDRPQDLQGGSLATRYQQEMNLGYQRALSCLQRGKPCLPARTTILGRDQNKPALTRPARHPGGPRSRRARGSIPCCSEQVDPKPLHPERGLSRVPVFI